MKDLDKIPNKNTELAWRVIDGEAVIIPLDEQTKDSEKIDFMNPTGTRIWEFIDGKNTIKQIIDKILEEYEIEQKDAQKEVVSFIKKLKSKKLVEI